jgi:hypothetical protein
VHAGRPRIDSPAATCGIIDVTLPPYNIDKTGQTNVADTLNSILQKNATWKVIYLPNGTYRVSKTVAFLDCAPFAPFGA